MIGQIITVATAALWAMISLAKLLPILISGSTLPLSALVIADIELLTSIVILLPATQRYGLLLGATLSGGLLLLNVLPFASLQRLTGDCKCFGSAISADIPTKRAVASLLLLSSFYLLHRQFRLRRELR